ncbi:guanylate kinase [Vallitalea guaymasensis]|uniref:guanylate kinase n=1 Tax=Vallitalea guaymasensis TaxID=1185412 RepID=UPI000DE38752|nr:guanylate kinase [Vallitalea guaymasensis]
MQEMLTQTLTNIGIALVVLLASYATYYIKKATAKAQAEIDKIEDDKQQKLLVNALDSLEDLAYKTVASIEQTTAKNLRELVKDGKADKQELKELSKDAAARIYNQLKPEYCKVLEDNFCNLEKYILDTIETNLPMIKKSTS